MVIIFQQSCLIVTPSKPEDAVKLYAQMKEWAK